jgi:hypothetical protein
MTSTAMQPSSQPPSPLAASAGPGAPRSPLAQLLHALNQPLTGLQCAMEVALAMPRTSEQYVRGLREGLQLTERMRALVEALREVADAAEEKEKDKENKNANAKQRNNRQETIELQAILREVVDDLAPIAELKSVRIRLDCPETSPLAMLGERPRIVSCLFRLVESALSLAARNHGLGIEAGGPPQATWFRVRWQAAPAAAAPAYSRPELGLMVAQAVLERWGAAWQRERTETFDTVTVRLPSPPPG